MNCLNPFYTEKKLEDHEEYCNNNEAVKCVYPKKGEKMYFKHGEKKMRVPFKIYADFEAFTEPLDTCQPNPGASYTMPYQKHTPASFCYYVKCFDDDIYPPKIEKFTKEKDGDDVAKRFVDKLREEVKAIYDFIKRQEKKFKYVKNMIDFDKETYDEATVCHICEKPFEGEQAPVTAKKR